MKQLPFATVKVACRPGTFGSPSTLRSATGSIVDSNGRNGENKNKTNGKMKDRLLSRCLEEQILQGPKGPFIVPSSPLTLSVPARYPWPTFQNGVSIFCGFPAIHEKNFVLEGVGQLHHTGGGYGKRCGMRQAGKKFCWSWLDVQYGYRKVKDRRSPA